MTFCDELVYLANKRMNARLGKYFILNHCDNKKGKQIWFASFRLCNNACLCGNKGYEYVLKCCHVKAIMIFTRGRIMLWILQAEYEQLETSFKILVNKVLQTVLKTVTYTLVCESYRIYHHPLPLRPRFDQG